MSTAARHAVRHAARPAAVRIDAIVQARLDCICRDWTETLERRKPPMSAREMAKRGEWSQGATLRWERYRNNQARKQAHHV